MRNLQGLFAFILAGLLVAPAFSSDPQAPRLALASGWSLQSSAKVKEGGEVLSRARYAAQDWHHVQVPTTVVAALVRNKVYPDPMYGMNLRSIPGTTYPIGANFSNLPMPADSPFAVSWWYRDQFTVPETFKGKTVWLHLDGINYRANIWLNGNQIAKSEETAGAWRIHEFNVTAAALPGKPNVLAIEVFPPTETDLAITFVDWNPLPPDKNMGLWRDVYLTASGPVAVRHPFVETHLEQSKTTIARLTVNARLINSADKAVEGTLRGQIGTIRFQQKVSLAAKETKDVEFSSDEFPQLNITNPRLWWPRQMGSPELHDLKLEFATVGGVSDAAQLRFGIREITSELGERSQRLFKVNGKPILIRGGGWSSDLMLRHDLRRMEQEVRYTQHMGLNTIRLEGKLEPEEFFRLTDRYGILVMAGWCCCDFWEQWEHWKPEHYVIAKHSLEDQIFRLRSHPSLLVWLNGSDGPPPADVEQMYISVLKSERWPNPYISSATQKPTNLTGESGVKMTGPYDYVAPNYWLQDAKHGGAWSFNTETSMGPAVPPVESLRRMIPKDHLWPMDDWWSFHAGGGQFKNINLFTDAQDTRYGKANSVEEFAEKSQMMGYEGMRAMFEAYGRNKYHSTGVIQWMLNNAWPSLIWHLYDFYLQPGGGYFGAKKACEPLHPQYSYDDNSIWLVSSQYQPAAGLRLDVRLMDLNMKERFRKEVTLDAAPDSTNRVLTLPAIADLTSTYFLQLTLDDASGNRLSTNLYWLSTKAETLDFEKSTWYATPTTTYADYTALQSLPKVRVTHSSTTEQRGSAMLTRVTVENPSTSIAFFLRLKVNKGEHGDEVLPVLWDDNYISLLPGEKRVVTATYEERDLGAAKPQVVVEGWNTGRH